MAPLHSVLIEEAHGAKSNKNALTSACK